MGKKKSKLSSKLAVNDDEITVPDKNQVIGRVEQLLGGDRLLVSLSEDEEIIVRIPGKLRDHMLFRVNSYVLMREMIPGEKKNLDIIYRYSNEEAEYLIDYGILIEW